jgi:dimethylargininase
MNSRFICQRGGTSPAWSEAHTLPAAARYDAGVLVIVRPPGPAFRDAISANPERDRIDASRARAQHDAFCAALEEAEVPLLRLPEEPNLPDATFVSDTLVALPPIFLGQPPAVVAARPAVASRRPEVESVLRAALASMPADTRVMLVEGPGTLEGGDVIVYGDRIAIGLGARTNVAGARVLADAALAVGYTPFLCPVADRLHLATAVTVVGPDTLIGTAAGFASLDAADPDAAPTAEIQRLLLPDDELPGANVLVIGGDAFIAAGNPTAALLLRTVGLAVHELDLSEFALADGGPTCLVNVLP